MVGGLHSAHVVVAGQEHLRVGLHGVHTDEVADSSDRWCTGPGWREFALFPAKLLAAWRVELSYSAGQKRIFGVLNSLDTHRNIIETPLLPLIAPVVGLVTF